MRLGIKLLSLLHENLLTYFGVLLHSLGIKLAATTTTLNSLPVVLHFVLLFLIGELLLFFVHLIHGLWWRRVFLRVMCRFLARLFYMLLSCLKTSFRLARGRLINRLLIYGIFLSRTRLSIAVRRVGRTLLGRVFYRLLLSRRGLKHTAEVFIAVVVGLLLRLRFMNRNKIIRLPFLRKMGLNCPFRLGLLLPRNLVILLRNRV